MSKEGQFQSDQKQYQMSNVLHQKKKQSIRIPVLELIQWIKIILLQSLISNWGAVKKLATFLHKRLGDDYEQSHIYRSFSIWDGNYRNAGWNFTAPNISISQCIYVYESI